MISKMVRVGVLWKFRPEEMTEMEQIAEFERTKPRLKVIYEHSNPADPEAMLVMRGRTKVGYINADDKRWLAPLMEKSRRGVMIDFDYVVPPSDGESAVLKYRVTVDESAIRPRLPKTDWEVWRYTFAQLDTTDSMDLLDSAFCEFMAIMEGADDAAMTLEECVEMICEHCRYDLSCETSERLDACCFALESKAQIAMLERLEAASTHRRGRRGVEEWRAWFEALVHSGRARKLMKLYKNDVRLRLGVSRVTRQQMAADLLALEQTLCKLPDQLFLYVDDPAQLMHMAFYRHITEVKQLELLSALVLRELLKTHPLPLPEGGRGEVTTADESDASEDEVSTPFPRGEGSGRGLSEELFHFIHPEVEDEEEARIHQLVKRALKRCAVQELCTYLGQLADEGKLLLPQSVKAAYDELLRMGMPTDEGFAYKTFSKYYRK